MKFSLLLTAVLVCAAPLAASAQTAAPSATTAPAATTGTNTATPGDGAGRWKNCSSDIQKLCGTVEKGHGAVRKCLQSHTAELTPACQTSLADMAAAHAARAADKAGAPAAAPTAKP